MPNAELEIKLRRDYAGIQEMIIGEAPDFDDVLRKTNAFELAINVSIRESNQIGRQQLFMALKVENIENPESWPQFELHQDAL